jgi:hypothetical protein
MKSVKSRLEKLESVMVRGKPASFTSVMQDVEEFLDSISVGPREFSHFGIVVRNIDDSVAALADLTGEEVRIAKQTWFEDYHVHVARLEEADLEFVQPAGKSFFLDFLDNHGEVLQHISYLVDNVEIFNACIERLRKNGVEVVEERLHGAGKIGFVRPKEFDPIYLEFGVTRK